ncbi:hypothetical protein ACLMJK_001207 [Lecanora helva]
MSDSQEDLIDLTGEDEPVSDVPTATKFVADLDEVPVEDINGVCPICCETYLDPSGHLNETIVVLPDCGHIFGKQCIEKWLDPTTEPPRNTCPLCRMRLFNIPEARGPDPASLNPADLSSPQEFLEVLEELSNMGMDQDIIRNRDIQDRTSGWDSYYLPSIHTESLTASRDPPDPSVFLFSIQIMFYFRRFTQGTGAGADEIATMLARLMGQLILRVRNRMEELDTTIPWDENGPQPRYLLDPSGIPLVEIALQSIIEVEQELALRERIMANRMFLDDLEHRFW